MFTDLKRRLHNIGARGILFDTGVDTITEVSILLSLALGRPNVSVGNLQFLLLKYFL